MNTERLKNAAKHYGWGLLATSWNGGWAAVAGVVGIDAVAIVGVPQVRVLNFHEMVAAFIGACAFHAVLWIAKNPLPVTLETETPFPKPRNLPPP